MPWCEDCAKYWAPSAMSSDGTCPTCHRSLDTNPDRSVRSGETGETGESARTPITSKNLDLHRLAAGEDGDAEDMKAPWHFKLLMVLLALYLGWRIVQLFT